MLTHLLAATDFSDYATQATARAARLAHEHQATLQLLHVLPSEPLAELRHWLGGAQETLSCLQHQARSQLQELAATLEDRHPGADSVDLSLRCGKPATEILLAAEERSSDLIVVGARGSSFLRHLVLGTTAERLLRHTERPVLVVRQTPQSPYRRVLVALDFSAGSAATLALAQQLAPQAHLILMHAFELPFADKLRFAGVDEPTMAHYRHRQRQYATQQLHALAEGAALAVGDWTPLVLEGDPSWHLIEQEQACACDLVVLGKHSQSAAERLLLGSVTKHLLSEGQCDVLATTKTTTGTG